MIAEVIGSVISTRKHTDLIGNKFLIVELLECMDTPKTRMVAIDTVGAGCGDIVLIVTGSAARKSIARENVPVDAAIVGIVDDENDIALNR